MIVSSLVLEFFLQIIIIIINYQYKTELFKWMVSSRAVDEI